MRRIILHNHVYAHGYDEDFVESEHKRDKTGEFATASGAGASGTRTGEGGAPLPAHVAALKIPPAWTNVRYANDPGASLLVVGTDSKNRPQAIYSIAHAQKQAAAKFARVAEMQRKFDSMKKQNDAARASSEPRVRATADCLALVMATGIRPGSDEDTGADKKAYGATTLTGSHVVDDKDGIRLEFIGKKGVSLSIPVTDPGVASMLRERASRAGPSGKLFDGTDEKRLLMHVHGLDGGSFKTKDFRTHVGTTEAARLVQHLQPPKSEKDYKKAVMDVAKQVAKRLGNTPIVALQSYINPAVFAGWRSAVA